MNPTQIQSTDFSAGMTTYTAGGVTVEGGATLLRQYTINGRSGSAIRRGYSAGQSPNVPDASKPNRITTDGHRLFRELHKFLKNYADVKADPIVSHAYALAFHDFINDDHYIINPKQFTIDRSGGGDFRYTIQFDAVADRVNFQLGLLASIAPALQLATDVVSTTVNNMAGMVNDVTNSVAELGENLEAALGQVSTSVRRLSDSVNRARSTNVGFNELKDSFFKGLNDVKDSVTEELLPAFGADPKSARDSARNGAEQATALNAGVEASGLNDAGLRAGPDDPELDVMRSRLIESQGGVPPLAFAEDFNPFRSTAYVNSRRSVMLLENALYARLVQEEATKDAVGRSFRGSAKDETRRFMSQSNSEFVDYSQFLTIDVPILRGDTLRSICMRHVGNMRAMEYIIQINSLKFPYISESGEPFTLRYGSQIKVPALRGQTSSTKARSQDSLDRALFGEDFRLTKDGDLVLSNSLDDFSLISGIPNLKQALEIIKFRTKLGSNPVFPQIGMPDLIGGESTEDNVLSVYLGAKLCAEIDPRIELVEASALWDQGDTVNVMLDCKAINNTESFQIGVVR